MGKAGRRRASRVGGWCCRPGAAGEAGGGGGGDLLGGGGDRRGGLVRGGDGGVTEDGGEIGRGAVERRLCRAGGVPGGLAGRVIGDLAVGPDRGGVVADLVDAVVG